MRAVSAMVAQLKQNALTVVGAGILFASAAALHADIFSPRGRFHLDAGDAEIGEAGSNCRIARQLGLTSSVPFARAVLLRLVLHRKSSPTNP